MENMSPQVIRRVTKEMMELAESPPEGIKIFINERDITDIQATIIGPGDIIMYSLVPRPFEGRRKGLVHTVCACAKFTEIFLV